jgi:hypothetical protein
MRLFLFRCARGIVRWIPAVAVVVPESDFERATAGGPIVSVEFHAP